MAGARLESSGIEGANRGAQQIANLLGNIGRQEQIRQERQQLNRVTQIVAEAQAAGTQVTTSQILSAINQPVETDTGFRGLLQKIGGRFQPEPGRLGAQIEGGIVSDALKRASQPQFDPSTVPEGLVPSSVSVSPTGGITRSFARPTGKTRTLTSARLKQIDKKIAAGTLKEGSKEHLRLLGASGDKIKTPEDKLQFWQRVLQQTIDAIGTPLEGQEGTAKLASQKIQEAQDELAGTQVIPDATKSSTPSTLDPDISDTDLDALIESLSQETSIERSSRELNSTRRTLTRTVK